MITDISFHHIVKIEHQEVFWSDATWQRVILTDSEGEEHTMNIFSDYKAPSPLKIEHKEPLYSPDKAPKKNAA